MKKSRAVILVSLPLLAGACARPAPQTDAMRVIPLSGDDVFLVEGKDETRISDPEELTAGDGVRTSTDGWAMVELPDGRRIELAPSSRVLVGGDARAELVEGRALFHAPAGIAVSSGPAEIHGSGGTFRLDRYVGVLSLGVYTGSATVEGWDGEVGALQEAGISAGIVPVAPRPLRVSPSDRWDSRLLGGFIDAGQDLADIVGGLASQLPGGVDLEAVVQALPQAFPVRDAIRYLKGVSPAEGLVSAMLALQASRDEGGRPLRLLDRIVDLRRLGASWIVVLATWHLAQERLAALEQLASQVIQILFPSISATDTAPTTGGPATGGGTASSTSGTGSTVTGTDSSTSGGDGGSGSTGGSGGGGGDSGGGSGSSEPPATCSSELECTIEDVLGTDPPDLGL